MAALRDNQSRGLDEEAPEKLPFIFCWAEMNSQMLKLRRTCFENDQEWYLQNGRELDCLHASEIA